MEKTNAARSGQTAHAVSLSRQVARAAWRGGAAGLALLALAGCAHDPQAIPGLTLDRSATAVGQDHRVRFVVLHYTAADASHSLRLLSQGKVSAHYLVSDDADARVYKLVDENERAWHAGVSGWKGRNNLNDTSIGIEIVNRGNSLDRTSVTAGTDLAADPAATVTFRPYSPQQIDRVRVLLKSLVARYGIAASDVVGHSDIAPQRKLDPGPLFPWRELAQDGIGRWYDAGLARQAQARFEQFGVPDIAWFQRQLARIGYDVPADGVATRATTNVIAAFQMHYRPARFDGQPDAETAAILEAMPL
jgi:N-acetylmuramoyl-L-alanine amidase